MGESEVGSVGVLDEYGKFAGDLEGYVIAPIPLDRYVPKLESNIYQYREIFPHRAGSKPLTTRHEPHQQITQHGKVELWDELLERCATLPDVTVMDESFKTSAVSSTERPPKKRSSTTRALRSSNSARAMRARQRWQVCANGSTRRACPPG